MINEWDIHNTTISRVRYKKHYCSIFEDCTAPDIFRYDFCAKCPLYIKHNLELDKLSDDEIIEQVTIHLLLTL